MAVNLNIDKKIFLPVYYPYLFDYSKRYNVYYGGRASGKTYFLIQKLLLKGLKEKRVILLMNKQTNKVSDGVWRELNNAIDLFHLRPYFTFNKTEFRATCILNGTQFRCLGLDDPERIKGFADIADVLLDEATNFSVEDFELIDGTIRSPKYKLPLQVYVSFNPVSKANWVYKYFGFDTGIVPDNTFILKTTYLDNTFLDLSYHQRMENLKNRNYSRWKIEALGDFVSLDRLVYDGYWKEEDFDYKQLQGQLLIGMDFGFTNDPSVIVASLLVDQNIYVFQEWGDTGKTNPELANVIKNMGFSKSLIIADSSEQKSIEEIRRLGVQRIKASVKGPDSIIHGIQRVQQYNLIIHPSCQNIITELENYSWQKDKNGEYINKPQDSFNHYLDALRYSLQCLDTGRLKSFDKSLLGL